MVNLLIRDQYPGDVPSTVVVSSEVTSGFSDPTKSFDQRMQHAADSARALVSEVAALGPIGYEDTMTMYHVIRNQIPHPTTIATQTATRVFDAHIYNGLVLGETE